MSVNAIWTAHCDGVGRPGCHFWYGQEDARREAVAAARKAGWLVESGRSGRVLCPTCRTNSGE